MKKLMFFAGSIFCYIIYLVASGYNAPVLVRFAIVSMQVVLLLIGLFWRD